MSDMTPTDAQAQARVLFARFVNMAGDDEQCIAFLAHALREAEQRGMNPVVTPVTQRDGNGCYAASIASITGLSLDSIPHPEQEEMTRDEFWRYRNRLNTYLIEHGWMIVTTWLRIPKGLSIVTGLSPRNIHHCCVALDGEIIHDPHPDGGGVKDIVEYEIIIPLCRQQASIERAEEQYKRRGRDE